FFFFSSRRRHTRFSRDWSSDVCSSDLNSPLFTRCQVEFYFIVGINKIGYFLQDLISFSLNDFFETLNGNSCVFDFKQSFNSDFRSEERRVGKECSSCWCPYLVQ